MSKEIFRLTLDFPSKLHNFLKMAAAEKGVSMHTYIVDSLMYTIDHEDKVDLDNKTFRQELAKMQKKDAKLMKDLSNR